MNLHEIARRIAVVANALIILSLVSLFVTVLAWHLSVAMFAGCWVLYAMAWVLEGGAVRREMAAAQADR